MQSAFTLAADLRSTCWAITESGFHALDAVCTAAMARGSQAAAAAPTRRPPAATGGSVAVISIAGIVEQRPGWLTMLGLGTACSDVSSALRAALQDSRVGRIVLAVDSPGGSVFGVQELADEIFAARSQKAVFACVEGMAGSAGYWLASQASKLYASSSSEVGSIGVFCGHVDQSRALDREGLGVTLISAGKFKVEQSAHKPLSTEAQAFMQQRVDDYYKAFVGAVARGRGVSPATVRAGFGEGRMVGIRQALGEKMIDATATLGDVLIGRPDSSSSAKASLAARQQWRREQIRMLERLPGDAPARTALAEAKRQLTLIEAGA